MQPIQSVRRMPVERLSPSSVVDVDLLGVLGWVT
jgi:hypothetical protein